MSVIDVRSVDVTGMPSIAVDYAEVVALGEEGSHIVTSCDATVVRFGYDRSTGSTLRGLSTDLVL
jgi:hypothetical protein